MNIGDFLQAALLGILEGLTEFIPVSSTAHLLLAGHFLGFSSTGKAFEVMIQLGSILALVSVYATKLMSLAKALPSDPDARRFAVGVVLAFLPAAVVGVLAHDFIKTVLFETPIAISIVLIVGGVVLLIVDRLPLVARYRDATRFPLRTYLAIGVCQTLALVPGVSRSGATIVGALFLGADKRAAAEFSFYLAMPTMLGAFVYDFYKNRDVLSGDDLALIAVGFVAAFVSGVLVVRHLLDFVARRGYALFGWWRIVVGSVSLLALLAYG